MLNLVFSHSWKACVPHLPAGVKPAVTGRSLNRKWTQSFICSLRRILSPAASGRRLQLAPPLGKMDPDRPPTARLLAALEIRVRPQAQVGFTENANNSFHIYLQVHY